ncbi:hypothetical protein HPB49_003512 [Dermacentor silvarum]|uniref:Uncharacterized protein n=1 Tax=Dermacentor silvarum TaxID=543639 RepID=A0ACB8DMS0_DERSI|nr:hypothetical protein HPB49_003512 [Dermacentor silvarum]
MASQKARLQNTAVGRAILHRTGTATELRALDGQRALPPEVRSKIKANPIPKHMSHELREGRRKARVDRQRRQFKSDPYVTLTREKMKTSLSSRPPSFRSNRTPTRLKVFFKIYTDIVQGYNMVFCSVVGCSNSSDSSRRKKKPTNTNFFRIPRIVVDRCERSKTLSTNRRTLWLARINPADLDPQNPNLCVCVGGANFVTGTPSDFFDSTNTDWASSLHLGYSIRHADANRYERSELRRQRKTGVCTPDNLAANRAV